MSDPVSLLTGKVFAPLETAGNKIVDQDGEAVFIKAINWYGMELESFGVPAGVDQRSLADIMQTVADLGFNTLRLPVSTFAVLDPYEVDPWFGIDFEKNPELEGANSLEVLEHVIDEAATVGLSVIIDNHNISSEGWEGRWYDADYTEAEWVDMWETLAATLGDKDNVIGADLRNEPFDAAWDNWSTAAETAGNAIHAVDGDWLVIVEGVHHSMDGDWYQWAGNLKDAHVDPIVLNQDNKVVYSVHEYPDPVATKLELTPGSTYYSLFDEYWGNISLELNAPVFVGEFGFRNDSADDGWTEALSNYFRGDTDGDGVIDDGGSPIAGFAYWCLAPPEDLGHNLLGEDFLTVRQEVWADLEPLVTFEPDWVGELPFYAHAGNEFFYGGGRDDFVQLGDGNDHAYLGAGNDTVFAGGGNDFVEVGPGSDEAYLGAGDDTLRVAVDDVMRSRNVADGDEGFDTLQIVLNSAQARLPAVLRELRALENFISTAEPDDEYSTRAVNATISGFELLDIVVTGVATEDFDGVNDAREFTRTSDEDAFTTQGLPYTDPSSSDGFESLLF